MYRVISAARLNVGKEAKRPVANGPLRVLKVARGWLPKGGYGPSLIHAILICLIANARGKTPPIFSISAVIF